MRGLLLVVVVLTVVLAAYTWFILNWSYSSGERAGWVQKLSKKGWFCKTWEGELAMVSMPGATPEKFYFTVPRDEVAERINKVMGKRVSLHYEEKVGLPTSCFGETRHFVTRVAVVEDIPLAPGISVPTRPEGSTESPGGAAPGGSDSGAAPGAPGTSGATGAAKTVPPAASPTPGVSPDGPGKP